MSASSNAEKSKPPVAATDRCRNAVDQHQSLVVGLPPLAHVGDAAERAVPGDVDPGQGLKDVGREHGAPRVDLGFGHHAGGDGVLQRTREAGSGDDHLLDRAHNVALERDGIILGEGGWGSRQAGGGEQKRAGHGSSPTPRRRPRVRLQRSKRPHAGGRSLHGRRPAPTAWSRAGGVATEAAGLLARGSSQVALAFPDLGPVAPLAGTGGALAAHSCGHSRGLLTAFPFNRSSRPGTAFARHAASQHALQGGAQPQAP
jgi:hypothetical protein